MQEHDARILRGAAIPTAVTGLIAMAVGFAYAGLHGLLGGVFATLLVLGCFAVSAYVIAWTGERNPQLMLPVAFLVYTTKIGILAVVLLLFGGSTAFDHTVFAFASLACIVVWLGGQAVASKRVKQFYVEPDPQPAAESEREGEQAAASPGEQR
ncbi:hypothetical protein [Nocardiopsis composta]|uniref:ATP synthase protein I n=1 Tax=Nocardiopsis composta TaxID=157465 RepID=A0A7W8QMT9_9ACTN|nr:hypothetical protein [Nocardiopsis composta]MBB5432705.1 ATP synthase protein I [Nocardiopsis composta]